MRFTEEFLRDMQDSGKDVCVFSSEVSKSLFNCDYKNFTNFSRRLYYFWRSGEKAIPLPIVFNLIEQGKLKEQVNIEAFSICGGNKITPPDENSNTFYYFLGLLLGDGCLVHAKRDNCRHTYLVQITFRYKYEAEEIKEFAKNLFNLNASIYPGVGRCFNLCLYSKPLVMLLHKRYQVPIGLKYSTLCVPKIVYQATKYQTISFLKGVFDSDGNICLSKNRRSVQLRQKSYTFLNQLRILFLKVGIVFNNAYYDKANNSWVLWSSKRSLVDTFINEINNFKIVAPVAQPG